MTGLKEQQLFESFSDKEYRDAFVEEYISSGLAFQIRALREKNGWTQGELAQRTGKAQETPLVKLCLAVFNLNEFVYVD